MPKKEKTSIEKKAINKKEKALETKKDLPEILIEENQEEKKKKYWIYLLLCTIVLFFVTFGMTYSIKKGNDLDDSEIQTGQIFFNYSDALEPTSGIELKDAFPINNDVGKMMVGKGQYFDFYVTSTTKSSRLKYKLLMDKDESSSLQDSNVKVYLTEFIGNAESELLLSKVSDLPLETVNDKQYYVLYEKILEENLDKYIESFRFRMWVDQDAVDYTEKFYSVKIHVNAFQIED